MWRENFIQLTKEFNRKSQCRLSLLSIITQQFKIQYFIIIPEHFYFFSALFLRKRCASMFKYAAGNASIPHHHQYYHEYVVSENQSKLILYTFVRTFI